MDLAAIIGIAVGGGVVFAAIFIGGSLSQFIDVPSMLIVLGGGLAATLIRFPISGIGSAFAVGGKASFTHKKIVPRDLVERITEMADIVRKSGPLGLENIEIDDPTLAKGVQYIADGYDTDFIRETLERERDLYLERLAEGKRVFKALCRSKYSLGVSDTQAIAQNLGISSHCRMYCIIDC